MDTIIYHNPRCSKSRATLALLVARGIPHRVVDYLKTPPDRAALEAIVRALGGDPRALVRTQEAPYAALRLAQASATALLDALATHPVLIERPIVVHGTRAALGRPPENVLALFEQ